MEKQEMCPLLMAGALARMSGHDICGHLEENYVKCSIHCMWYDMDEEDCRLLTYIEDLRVTIQRSKDIIANSIIYGTKNE